MAEISELKSRSKVIVVGRESAEVHEDLRVSLLKEARYDHYADLRCDLKWTAEGGQRNPCNDCPHHKANTTEDDAMALLCSLGRHQNSLLDELAGITALDRLDEALVAAYERDVASVDELVAALV
jgi:hypothetical protein